MRAPHILKIDLTSSLGLSKSMSPGRSHILNCPKDVFEISKDTRSQHKTTPRRSLHPLGCVKNKVTIIFLFIKFVVLLCFMLMLELYFVLLLLMMVVVLMLVLLFVFVLMSVVGLVFCCCVVLLLLYNYYFVNNHFAVVFVC